MPRLVLLFALVFTVAGCDALFPGSTNEEIFPAPLEILDVEVSPEVVRPGDQVTLTVVATRNVVEATWVFPNGTSELRGPTATWVAPPAAGDYDFDVFAREGGSTLDRLTFDVSVVE